MGNRFWDKVSIPSDIGMCWEWAAYKMTNGYDTYRVGQRKIPAHRVSYELQYGEIPTGLAIDHLCSNRACVNPMHLEAVTYRVNNARSIAHRTACPNGHPYEADAEYCRECNRIRCAARYAASKGM